MSLNNLQPAKGSVKHSKRVGRGAGSGKGGTATRGNKGAKSRSTEASPDIDMAKRIRQLEDENRQLKLQINALKKEIDRLNDSRCK